MEAVLIRNVGLIEFHKAEQIFYQTEPIKIQLRGSLDAFLKTQDYPT